MPPAILLEIYGILIVNKNNYPTPDYTKTFFSALDYYSICSQSKMYSIMVKIVGTQPFFYYLDTDFTV